MKKKGTTVEYICFYGFLNIKIKDEGIRSDIQKEMKNRICVHCCNSTTKEYCQADHKNSLKNNPRVLKKETQKKDDFQALCRSCNCLKRSAEKKAIDKGERFGATKYHYPIDFTIGNNILDKNNPNWHIGTYWGDVVAFKQSLYLPINLNEQLSEDSENNLDNDSIEKVTNTINNLIL